MIVREVQIYDVHAMDAIRRMHKSCLPYDEQPFIPSKGYWWIAYDDGQPVGFAGLKMTIRWIDCGYLWRSAVLPEYRGRGLQVKFIRLRERKARELGWKYMITDTSSNPASANNLIKCGYRIYEPSIEYGMTHTVYWRKVL